MLLLLLFFLLRDGDDDVDMIAENVHSLKGILAISIVSRRWSAINKLSADCIG